MANDEAKKEPRLIATNGAEFKSCRQKLIDDGWRIEWHDDSHTYACYRPDGEMVFNYGSSRESHEYWGAWAYLKFAKDTL